MDYAPFDKMIFQESILEYYYDPLTFRPDTRGDRAGKCDNFAGDHDHLRENTGQRDPPGGSRRSQWGRSQRSVWCVTEVRWGRSRRSVWGVSQRSVWVCRTHTATCPSATLLHYKLHFETRKTRWSGRAVAA